MSSSPLITSSFRNAVSALALLDCGFRGVNRAFAENRPISWSRLILFIKDRRIREIKPLNQPVVILTEIDEAACDRPIILQVNMKAADVSIPRVGDGSYPTSSPS